MSFNEDEMLILPAVDIKNGKCVQLVQGEPGSEMVEIDNPELVAKHWEDLGAKNIHVIDLDGTINGVASFDIIKKILKEYDRLIVNTKTAPDTKGKKIVEVDSFDELLDVRDNLKLPIKYYIVEEHKESKFYINHEEELYLYVVISDDEETNSK